MAIQIDSDLELSPNPLRLPGPVTASQTLRSDQDTETVAIEYSLDADHNVWFEDGGVKAKSDRRQETVRAAGTPLAHRLRLVEGAGQGPMDTVEVLEKITDQAGRIRRTMAVLMISR